MESELVRNLEREKIHYFGLFVGITKDKDKDIGESSQLVNLNNTL